MRKTHRNKPSIYEAQTSSVAPVAQSGVGRRLGAVMELQIANAAGSHAVSKVRGLSKTMDSKRTVPTRRTAAIPAIPAEIMAIWVIGVRSSTTLLVVVCQGGKSCCPVTDGLP